MASLPASPDKARALLSALALFCRSAAWFPLWMLLFSLTPRRALPLSAAALTVCGMLISMLSRQLHIRYRIERTRAGILSLLTALPLSALCGYAVLLLTGGLTVTVTVTALHCIMSLRKADADADELFAVRGYTAFLTGSVLVPVMMYFAKQEIPVNLLIGVIGAVSAGFLLLRNQFMLLRLVNRRTNIDTDVPQEIRRGNLLMLLGITVLPAAVFVFRAPLLALLQQMADTALLLLGMLLRGIAGLVAWLGGDAPLSDQAEAAQAAEEQLTPPGSASPLWALLWIPFFAVTCYVWHMFLSGWAEAIRDAFGTLMLRLTRPGQFAGAGKNASGAEYTDTETAAHPVRTGTLRKSWKKQVRKWQRMPDEPAEAKFYAGYRLLLDAPAWERGSIKESDTALAVCGKWEKQNAQTPALLVPVTDALHTEKYAEQGLPDGALRELEQTLRAMSK